MNIKREYRCHVCGQGSLEPVPQYLEFVLVTSDCQPYRFNRGLFICSYCGMVQKNVDSQWIAEIDKVYEDYNLYHQGDGEEQKTFEEETGAGISRSERLLRNFTSCISLPGKGRLLDIGCGNGSLLRSFARLRPGWSLCGTELNSKYVRSVENIEQVKKVYCGFPENVPGKFDVVTMVHVLEHIPDPNGFLQQVKSKLKENGLLVIQVPDYSLNPFDLLIADHCTHFTSSTLEGYLNACGFTVEKLETSWIPKEITAVVEKRGTSSSGNAFPYLERDLSSMQVAAACLTWLGKMRDQAKRLSEKGRFGIFGTSIAATWIAGELKTGIDFFVDEDQSRIGKQFMGKEILSPKEVPEGSCVFVFLSGKVAGSICERLKKTCPRVAIYAPFNLPIDDIFHHG